MDCTCQTSECVNVTDNKCSQCKSNTSWYLFEDACCPCSEHCNQTMGEETCQVDNGRCLNGCQDGYFGEQCIETCGNNCAPENQTTCSNVTGHCQNGCLPGWFMPKCDFNCTNNFPHCKECKEYMYPYTDRFVQCYRCGPGYYRDFQSGFCKSCYNCLNNTCDGVTGQCTYGCQEGWYSLSGVHYQCQFRCGENCLDQTCNNTNGICTNGCNKGFYGLFCHMRCPTNCINGTCDSDTGHCDDGCIPGTFGYHCLSTCQSRCGDTGCDKESGRCVSKYHILVWSVTICSSTGAEPVFVARTV